MSGRVSSPGHAGSDQNPFSFVQDIGTLRVIPYSGSLEIGRGGGGGGGGDTDIETEGGRVSV